MADLKEFIKQTLNDISTAASEFNEETENIAFPKTDYSDQTKKDLLKHGFMPTYLGGEYATMIEFDVAVSAESSEKAAGGGKVDIKVLGINGGLTEEKSSANISRTKFVIPLKVKNEETEY